MKKKNDPPPEEIPHIELWPPEGVDPQAPLPSLDELQDTPGYQQFVRALATLCINIAQRKLERERTAEKEEEANER
jgi:hypothetical protein